MKFIFSVVFSCVIGSICGQITGSEQDCMSALKICDRVVVQPNSYRGDGENEDEIPISTCLATGENNSVWYFFSIADSGLLEFLITPFDSVDYDFALYQLDTLTCNDIKTGVAPEVRCSFAQDTSNPTYITGIATGGTGTSAGPRDSVILEPLTVKAGERYVLLVDNFYSNSNSGFTLDFSASTAVFDTCMNTGIESKQTAGDVGVYPNPTNGALFIHSSIAGEYRATVINTMGKEVLQSTLQGGHPQQMDVSQLPNGAYFIRIEQGDEVSVKRIALFK